LLDIPVEKANLHSFVTMRFESPVLRHRAVPKADAVDAGQLGRLQQNAGKWPFVSACSLILPPRTATNCGAQESISKRDCRPRQMGTIGVGMDVQYSSPNEFVRRRLPTWACSWFK
jgi:hypothetical protein